MKNIIPALFFLIALVDIAKADTMYCGDKIISDGDSKAKVIIRCGQPLYKEVVEIQGSGQSQTQGQIHKLNKNTYGFSGNTSSTSSEVAIEKWFYNTEEGQFVRILTFKGGICIKIETGDKP